MDYSIKTGQASILFSFRVLKNLNLDVVTEI